MIEIIKRLLRKKQNPYDMIKCHIRIFEDHLRNWDLEGDYSCPGEKHWNLAVKIFEQQDYLNRRLNAEYHTNIFDYKLEPITNIDDDFSFIDIIGNNLKSELVLLEVPYNKIQTLKKNYKKDTYVVLGKNVNISNKEVYNLRAIIDNKEIYVLKGNENGI